MTKDKEKIIAILIAIVATIFLIIALLFWIKSGSDTNTVTEEKKQIEQELGEKEEQLEELKSANYDLAHGMEQAISKATETAKKIYGLSEEYTDEDLLRKMEEKYSIIKACNKRIVTKSTKLTPKELEALVDEALSGFNEFMDLSKQIENENIQNAIQIHVNQLDSTVEELGVLKESYRAQSQKVKAVEKERDEYKEKYENVSQELTMATEELTSSREALQDALQSNPNIDVTKLTDKEVQELINTPIIEEAINKRAQAIAESKPPPSIPEEVTNQIERLLKENQRIRTDSINMRKTITKLEQEKIGLTTKVSDYQKKLENSRIISPPTVYYWKDRKSKLKVPLNENPKTLKNFFLFNRDIKIEFYLRQYHFENTNSKQCKITLKLLDRAKQQLTEKDIIVEEGGLKQGKVSIEHSVFKDQTLPAAFYIRLFDEDNNSLLENDYKFVMKK